MCGNCEVCHFAGKNEGACAKVMALGEGKASKSAVTAGLRRAKAKQTDRLSAAGLKSTLQRCLVADLIFRSGSRHFSVRDIAQEAKAAGHRLSLATVYNTLNVFAARGLIRKVGACGEGALFDNDTSHHAHFFIESENRLVDIPLTIPFWQTLPDPPEGYCIDSIELTVNLVERKRSTAINDNGPLRKSTGALAT